MKAFHRVTTALAVLGFGLLAWSSVGKPTSSSAMPEVKSPPLGSSVLDGRKEGEELAAILNHPELIVPRPSAAYDDSPSVVAPDCHSAPADRVAKVCMFGSKDASRYVAAIGDSKAFQWLPALVEIAEQEDLRLASVTKSACPLARSIPVRDDAPYVECGDWVESVMVELRRSPPDIAIVSQGGSEVWELHSDSGASMGIVDGMLAAYSELEALGIKVILLIDNPHPGFDVPKCVADSEGNVAPCTFLLHDREESGARQVQEEVVRRGHFGSVDMIDMLCPDGTCYPVIGEVLVYRAGSHLTGTYVKSLTPVLRSRLMATIADTDTAYKEQQ